MDELVGMESDWIKTASPGITGNTAYGYVQFTVDTVETAVNRYLGHIERFNDRKDIRGWQPWGVPKGTEMQVPLWLTKLNAQIKAGTYKHEYELNKLTYDQTVALAFVHLHSAAVSKDSNFRLLSKGDVTAAKTIYSKNHHTNPDAATLLRLNITNGGFFRIHYVSATTIISVLKQMPISQAANLLYNMISEQIFTDKYKENRDAVKAANGAP